MALRYSISNHGLQQLRDVLGFTALAPRPTEFCDVIFVAIDFENLGNIKQGSTQDLDSQFGIAILDTTSLTSSQVQKPIAAYSFATGSAQYCTTVAKRFLFGKTTVLRQQDIITTLESLVLRSRNIILVGHSFQHDLHILQVLKFDLHTSIVGILDTQRIASELFLTGSDSLIDILNKLECPFAKLHTAGNDAYFTLQALLLLAERSCHVSTANTNDLDILASIRAITQVSVFQQRLDPQEKGRQKKLKREQRNRKQQSKFWDTETQELIRAERAARRNIRTASSIQY